MALNIEKIYKLSLSQLLKVLEQEYSNCDIEYNSLPNRDGGKIWESVLIDGIVQIWFGEFGDCIVTVLHQDLKKSDAVKTVIINETKNKEWLKQPGDTHYDRIARLFNNCVDPEHKKIPTNVQPVENINKTKKSKTKKIYTRGLVTYMVAVLIMFAAFESGLYISKKNYNKSINEIHNRVQKQMQHDCDSICDAAQNKLDSLNAAIEQRKAALNALDKQKQPKRTK